MLLKKNEAKMKQDEERNQFTFLFVLQRTTEHIYTHELLVINKEEEATVLSWKMGIFEYNIFVMFQLCLSP